MSVRDKIAAIQREFCVEVSTGGITRRKFCRRISAIVPSCCHEPSPEETRA